MKTKTAAEHETRLSVRIGVIADLAEYGKNRLAMGSRHGFSDSVKKARKKARFAWRQAGSPRLVGGPVQVDVHVVRSTGDLLDEFNIVWALSGFIDGLFVKAITPDDSPRYVKLGAISQESDPRERSRERIIFTAQLLEAQLWA